MHKNDDGTREYRSARVPQTPRLSIYATFYLHARIWHPIVNNKVISIFATLSLSSLTMRMVAASEMQAFVSCSHVCVFFSFFTCTVLLLLLLLLCCFSVFFGHGSAWRKYALVRTIGLVFISRQFSVPV